MVYVFTKYAWVKSLKDKTFVNGFIEIVSKSKRQPKKLWVHQRKELYNSQMQKRLDEYDILMYSAFIEGKLVVAERFIKTLKG